VENKGGGRRRQKRRTEKRRTEKRRREKRRRRRRRSAGSGRRTRRSVMRGELAER
jgi:hypothetical protein